MGVLIDPTEFQCLRVLVARGDEAIGAAVARRLTLGGARVAITASASRTGQSGAAHVIAADPSVPGGIEEVIRRVGEGFGGLDILVNIVSDRAGPSRSAPDPGEAEWQDALEAHLLAAVRLDRAFIPAMLDQGAGVIVHVAPGRERSSSAVPLAGEVARTALAAYSRGLAADLGPRGIRVSMVAPVMGGRGQPSSWGGVRGASLESAAELVAFLVSDRAASVRGGEYVIDGYARPVP